MPEDPRLSRLRAASEWLLRIQDASRTEADIDEWLRWCSADPENLVEFEKVQGDWRELDFLKPQPAPIYHLSAPHGLPAMPPIPLVRRFRRATVALGVAACACLIALTALWMQRPHAFRHAPQQLVATDMIRAATLPDGSRVLLRPQSTLLVHYLPEQRDLNLLGGEAFFKVAHDKRHPFIVHAGDMRVIAVGTAFDVRRGSGQVTVTVEEGIVEVADDAWSKDGLPGAWRVKAGYQFSYSRRRRAEMIARTDVLSALRWRDGELAYVDEPLGSVVEDLNRYSTHRITIEDPAIARLPFTGTAFTNSLSDWLQAVQQAYPVKITGAPNGDIVLTSRTHQQNPATAP